MDDFRKLMMYGVPAAALAFAVSSALAENPLARAPAAAQQRPLTTAQAPADMRMTPGAARQQPDATADPLANRDMRMSKVLGQEVADREGRVLGEVQDLLIDASDGKVAFAVLTPGGPANANDALIEVPMSDLRGGVRDGAIALTMDASRFSSLRSFEPGERARRRAHERLAGPDGEPGQPRYRRATEVLAAALEDRQGRKVGEVEDIVMNLDSGRIRYGVAQFDTSWFRPGKLVVMPVHQVRPDEGSDDYVLIVDREQLARAPAFDRSQWPDVNDRAFRDRLDETIG